ncbi:hypothetical protein BDV12DRAFT_178410 [Aspergillus spectabilis]
MQPNTEAVYPDPTENVPWFLQYFLNGQVPFFVLTALSYCVVHIPQRRTLIDRKILYIRSRALSTLSASSDLSPQDDRALRHRVPHGGLVHVV